MRLDAEVIRKQQPETYAIQDIRGSQDLIISQKMFAACPAFGDESAGPPVRHYQAEIHMGSGRGLFTNDASGLPVYEGRMIDHYDHRAKTYVSGHGNSAVWVERSFRDAEKAVVPQWRMLRETVPNWVGNRVDRYRVGFGDVANPRNERSLVATIIPPRTLCGHKVTTFVFEPSEEWAFLPWLAVANSFCMDWLARTRLTSPTMSFTLLDSLPFPRPPIESQFVQRVAPMVLRLTCTSADMSPFWNRMARLGFVRAVEEERAPVEAVLDPDERASLRADIDAIVARHVFALSRDELAHILESFPVLKRREQRTLGEYRTQILILERYDELLAS